MTTAPNRVCEGCKAPAHYQDSDGVDLCADCFDALPILDDPHECWNCYGHGTRGSNDPRPCQICSGTGVDAPRPDSWDGSP